MTCDAEVDVARELCEKAADFVLDMNSASQNSRLLCKTARDLRFVDIMLICLVFFFFFSLLIYVP